MIDNKNILLLGDVGTAFADADSIGGDCQIRENILDGILAAASGDFAIVAVVIRGVATDLAAAMKALRQSCDSRIVLLAQMWEEPKAIELTGSGKGRFADDYMICPLRLADLLRRPESIDETFAAGLIADPAKDEKIRHLERLATTDELTGLKNRRYIWEFARQVMDAAKNDNDRVTILMFDIDDFKHYNDVYSHSAGDEILKQAAILMRRCCRPHDIVGRIGGDEFAVIFWDDPKRKKEADTTERRSTKVDHPREPIFIADRFRTELNTTEMPSLGPEGKGVLSISGGLASFPRDGQTVTELFQKADEALLEAKRSGKNRIYLVGQ